ncbi:two-component system response regulator RppA [Calothrix sp. PCC 6303]|uniref:two-component system response regulator RppA n=1 Tax=Calothrix sp. PCC 6303 TaxID=1170562 RepID=UPI0002A01304|nr:two-component system response regulator RppA [Calothrix sp. PCC 6303]AFZ01567.1 two component transcriptional regulator, winged helix family [Calothrix sp. PCC 6303]
MLTSQKSNQSLQKQEFNFKVLLVEDEPDIGAALKRVLKQQNYLVDWVKDGTEAWIHLENQQVEYAFAIFDWMLPGVTGLELCKRLRKHNNPLPILLLTARDRIEDKIAGLDAGADDYLVKPFNMVELVSRLQALQRRFGNLESSQLTVGNLTLDYCSNTVICENSALARGEIYLTNKELHVLEYLMKHPTQVISSEQIRTHLRQLHSESCSCVVSTHIRILREKLSECINPIETIHGLGYRFNLMDEST